MTEDDIPEPDRVEGAPHPRHAPSVIGHARQTSDVLASVNGQMHHAWLLTGPKGIGKATFAWAMAATLLAQPTDAGFLGPDPVTELAIQSDHPVKTRLAALSEPRLALVRRGWDTKTKRLKSQITVDEIRKLNGFLGLSAPDGGRRIVLIDTVDQMNTAAANAVLKLLEEPPAKVVFLLVSHQPGGLLPTIKSRCRVLRFDPLPQNDLTAIVSQTGHDLTPEQETAISALAQGSAGRAIELLGQGGTALYNEIIAVLASCPNLDRNAALTLANSATGRGTEDRRDLILLLFETALSRLARTGAGAPPHQHVSAEEASTLNRLSPTLYAGQTWAEAAETLPRAARTALAVNLDPSGVILDMVLKANETAGRITRH